MIGIITTLSTATSAGAAAGVVTFELVFGLISYTWLGLGFGGIFKKAGYPAWAGFVPIYNQIVLCQLCGLSPWLVLLDLGFFFFGIPPLILYIVTMVYLSKSFGKTGGYSVGLMLLPWIFLWILWLGSSRYVGPGAKMNAGGGYGGPLGPFGGPPGSYGSPYGAPPPGPGGQYGAPPPQQSWGPPPGPGGQYGAPPPQQSFGPPPGPGGQYGAPPPQQSFGPPPESTPQ